VETPASLLERLRLSMDADAWESFVQLYTPLLFRWLVQRHCPREEISDLMQDVFVTLVQVLPKFEYDRTKGFRRWLLTVALNKWRDHLKKRQLALIQIDGDGAEPLAGNDADLFAEIEYRKYLARRALEIMRSDFAENTWQACWRMTANDEPASQVAADLGMTVGAVYAAKFRVLQRLRHELTELWD